jgi:hypothetical protein
MRLTRFVIETDGHQKHHRLSSSIFLSAAILAGQSTPTRPERAMNWVEAAAYLASALVLATFCMKRMIPLRTAAIGSNIAFIVYGFYDSVRVHPVLVLHAILLPLNAWRAILMLRLISGWRRPPKAISLQNG